MKKVIFTGRANPVLAQGIAGELGMRCGACSIEDFPDGEIHVELEEPLENADVYLIQPTSPPVAEHLLELLLLADACRRAGAGRLSAVIPYFGYARQDRRTGKMEPVGARLVADMLSLRFNRIVVVDLHNPAIEGFFAIPVEHLSAVPLLAEALRSGLDEEAILVAPDLGAVKLAQEYGDRLGLPVAYIHKIRHSGEDVSVRRVIGSVKGRRPIIVDDMISTGGTVVSAVRALLEEGCLAEITVAVGHALLVGEAEKSLAELPVRRFLTTDSVQRDSSSCPLETVSLKKVIAKVIDRMHRIPEENSYLR
jgi:ribose-phosphate pyrophosphokinase